MIYFDRKLAIKGQKDPTQASNTKNAENRKLKKCKIDTEERAKDAKPRITSNLGFRKVEFF